MNLAELFTNTSVTSSINSFINFPIPSVVYNLKKPIQSTIFNFNKVTSEVNIYEFLSNPNYFICNFVIIHHMLAKIMVIL